MKKIFYYLLLSVLGFGCVSFMVRAVSSSLKDPLGIYEFVCIVAVFLYFALSHTSDGPSGECCSARQEGQISGFLAGLSFAGMISYDDAMHSCWKAMEYYRTLCENARASKPIWRRKDAYIPVDFASFAFASMESCIDEDSSPVFSEYVEENKQRSKTFIESYHQWE